MSVLNVDEKNFKEEVLNSKIPVLVDFYADWCGPCKIMGPMIDKLSEELNGKVKFCKVNVDNDKSLAMEYQVMTIPNFIFFKNGNKENSIVGVQTKEALLKLVED